MSTTTTTKATAAKATKATTAKASAAMVKAVVSKATALRPTDTMLRAALTSLGADPALTFEAGRSSLTAADRNTAAAGVVAFAHSEGIGVEKGTTKDIATALGVSVGNAAALITTGRVFGMLASDAKTLSPSTVKAFAGQVPADKRAAVLDAANVGTKAGRTAFAKAITSAVSDLRESQAKGRQASGKASTEGESEESGMVKIPTAPLAKIFSETAARLAKIGPDFQPPAKWNGETVAAFLAFAAQVERVAGLLPETK